MGLIQDIEARYKAAMKAQDAPKVSTLRMVKAKLKDYAIEKRLGDEISEADACQVIAAYVKQMRKSLPEFEKGGDAARDAIARIQAEIAYLEPFLPKLLDEAKTREIVMRVVAEMGKPPAQKTGMVMGRIMKEHAGKVDPTLVRRLVDEALGRMSRPAEGAPPLTSHRHPVAVRLRKLGRRPTLARREGVFLLDGVHLIEEALASPLQPETILIAPRLKASTTGQALAAAMTRRGWPLLRVTDELLESVAPTITPQGILGLFRRPVAPALPQPAGGVPGAAALVLAGLQDPANLGAIARAARVFGCPLLITSAGTVDPYHPRATRASSGSLLHLAIIPDAGESDLRSWVEKWGVRAVALVPRGGQALAARTPADSPLVLVLGSEGAGIPAAVEALCSERWSIPMAEGAESLGVAAAGAIALYAARAAGE